ncbi:hypothetical protein [Rhizobacter sp. SG703]|uniref:hypothetical protein n=1 Tax=Rhizobacter sp. SG703 TaxID=2587140 RepID=UPI0014481E69|nr:hypothetical protein [Rhizobacter sp. SG703]NKI96633.1 hypothetical protein [Rhizobacter sp. SG703]
MNFTEHVHMAGALSLRARLAHLERAASVEGEFRGVIEFDSAFESVAAAAGRAPAPGLYMLADARTDAGCLIQALGRGAFKVIHDEISS